MNLISIVLPTFNGEKYIAQAIDSCLRQTYTHFELIIVDDCSTDETPSIINAFAKKDNRIRVITNQQNQKLPQSLNIGFQNATGNYFTWTSDDNYYAPNALKVMAGHLDTSPDIDIVYSSYQFIDEGGNLLETFGKPPEHLLFKCIIGACFLYRRSVHEVLQGYSTEKFRMEDMDFWLRATQYFRYHFIDGRNLYFYRKHIGSLTFEIYRNSQSLQLYRDNYFKSFHLFFNGVLQAGFTEGDIKLHLELFFEDQIHQKVREFSLSKKLIAFVEYLEKLMLLDWEKAHFDKVSVCQIIREKRNHMLELVINDLTFDNKILSKRNPSLAKHIGKPVSWYYQEYEVLPAWYKKVGHLLKMLQRNKPLPSFINGRSSK